MNTKTYEKIITIKVKSTFEKKNQKIETTLKAELTTDDLNFKTLSIFETEKAKIDRLLKKMIKTCQPFEMTITTQEYLKNENYSNLKQLSFNCWEFLGTADYTENDAEMGVYLKPNTRYTPIEHDIWYDFTLESLFSIK